MTRKWFWVLTSLLVLVVGTSIAITLNHSLHLSDKTQIIVNLVLVAVNVGMMVASFSSVRETSKSAAATLDSVLQMKDSLRPYLDLHVSSSKFGLFITIRNVGVGPGVIKLISTRDDVGTDCLNRVVPLLEPDGIPGVDAKGFMPIKEAIFAPNESSTFYLGTGDTCKPDANVEGRWISSISLYYEDIYGRVFRSRILYEYNWMNGVRNVSVLNKETTREEDGYPLNTSRFHQLDAYRTLEGVGSPIKFNPGMLPLHVFSFVNDARKRDIPGNDTTRGKPLILQSVSFERGGDGNPVIGLRVGRNEPFSLRTVPQNRGPEQYAINPDGKFQECGLVSRGGQVDLDNVKALYRHAVNNILGIKPAAEMGTESQ